nr:reverse transcriptase domain-containing protein [Tanacetum cinerariifolium]
MEPKRTTRSTPVITTPTPETTTSVTNAQLQAMIDQGVTAALVAHDANRNGDDSHTSGMATHAMPWRTLKKMMTDKYCPRGEIKKLESEIWNLEVKGTDVVAYSQCFQELALMCDRMFSEEIDKIERYVNGLLDTIHGSGHFKRECPKLKNNNNRGNQVGNAKAQAKVYAVGKAGANPVTISLRGFHVFLANITATKDEDKSKGKRLEDLPVVQEFPEVFLEDLSGIPPT